MIYLLVLIQVFSSLSFRCENIKGEALSLAFVMGNYGGICNFVLQN